MPISFDRAGDYRIEVYSTDMAGNDEVVQVLNISYHPDAVTTEINITSPIVQEVSNPIVLPDEDTPPSMDYLNQYPLSLGDMTSDLSIPEQIVEEPETVAPVTDNTVPLTSNYSPPDTTVTVIEPTSPDVMIVNGNNSPLSAEDLATILSLTGLLATTTAAVGIQLTDTARRRREELEAERLEAAQQRQTELVAQSQRARENADMNARMRAEAQQAVILEVQVSEAYKEWQAHVAALMAEYHTHMERGQRINSAHTIHEQVQAIINSVDGTMNQYGSFMTADERAQLRAQLDAYNSSFANFQPDVMLEQVQGLNELYAPIIANVQSRYTAWSETEQQRLQEENETTRRRQAITVLGEINGYTLDSGWANRSAESLEQEAIAELPHAIKRELGIILPALTELGFASLADLYYTSKDARQRLLAQYPARGAKTMSVLTLMEHLEIYRNSYLQDGDSPSPTSTPTIIERSQDGEVGVVEYLIDARMNPPSGNPAIPPPIRLFVYEYESAVATTPDGEEITTLNFQSGVRVGLAEGIVDGRLTITSVFNLLDQALIEVEGEWSFSPSSSALYGLAYADAQGENWIEWEDNNALPVIYFGSTGAFIQSNPNILGGGNCTMFVSMALLAGGAEPSEIWNLGAVDTNHSDNRIIFNPNPDESPQYEAYFAGLTLGSDRPFTGTATFDTYLYNNFFGGMSISSDITVENYTLGVNNNITQSESTRTNAINELGVGDLIVSRNDNSSLDHVSMVVGWGPPQVISEQTFYPSVEVAQQNGVDTTGWVPYIVDHGGTNPQNYPRPWTEGTTTTNTNLETEPEVTVSIVNLSPTSRP